MPTVYQLRASLRGIQPEIWRRVRVPADLHLADLHEVLQTVMGWEDCHLHEFEHEGRRFGPDGPDGADGVEDEWGVTVAELLKERGDVLRYLYDFGDGWQHDVELERAISVDAAEEVPVCVDGRRPCPPEGCGGVAAYRELCGDREAVHEGVGEDVDPKLFVPDAVNERLEELFAECWVGGVLPLPAEMAEDLPVPHSLVVWLDGRYGTIVGRDVVPQIESVDAAVASVLRVFGESVTATGRAPLRLRVADARLAAKLRVRMGSDVAVVEGPTPELAELREAIAEQVAAQMGTCAEPWSYLDGGRIQPARMARFFEAAAWLYRTQPWERLGRGDLIVVESGELDLDGAVVLVAGDAEEDFGFLVFESAGDCATFLEGSGHGLDPTVEAPSVPTRLVHFERGASVPPPMRREIGRHLWQVADARAYPVLALLDGDGVARHIDEMELARMTACTEALARLLERRRDELLSERPVSDTLVIEDLPGEATVRVSVGLRSDCDSDHVETAALSEEPVPDEWLELDELERLEWVRRAHGNRREHPDTPDFPLHLSMHVTIENQLAMDDPREARLTLERLLSVGLDRHEAVHAIGAVMAEVLSGVLRGRRLDEAAYLEGLRRLTPESWLAACAEAGGRSSSGRSRATRSRRGKKGDRRRRK